MDTSIVANVVVVVLLALAFAAGLGSGLFASVGGLVGIAAAVVVSPWVLPWAGNVIPAGDWHGAAVVGAGIVLLLIGAGLGSSIGAVLRRGAERIHLGLVERLLGGVFALVAAVVGVSIAGPAIAAADLPSLSPAAASSPVVRTLEGIVPETVHQKWADAVADLPTAELRS